jgi:hypothetical protein
MHSSSYESGFARAPFRIGASLWLCLLALALPAVGRSSVRISLSPLSAALTATQTKQFRATVGGAFNSAVRWTRSPNVGTISATGLYTAPAAIAAPVTVTVAATSLADPTKSAIAAVTLLLNPPSVLTPSAYRINRDSLFTNSSGQRHNSYHVGRHRWHAPCRIKIGLYWRPQWHANGPGSRDVYRHRNQCCGQQFETAECYREPCGDACVRPDHIPLAYRIERDSLLTNPGGQRHNSHHVDRHEWRASCRIEIGIYWRPQRHANDPGGRDVYRNCNQCCG